MRQKLKQHKNQFCSFRDGFVYLKRNNKNLFSQTLL